jgi:hypothetical protein
MASTSLRYFAAIVGVALLAFSASPAAAQGSGPPSGSDQRPGGGSDPAKDQKKPDEFKEAERVLGSPAGNPECVWLGRRVVNLLWRDDLDTAFRHLDLYDRFGCPGGHVQVTFRCVVRQGNIDPKALESLNTRVHACWINPSLTPPAATASTPSTTPTTPQ